MTDFVTMPTIPLQTLVTEAIDESAYESKDKFFFEVRSDAPNTRVAGLTPMGYDDEIGFWEELDSREGKKAKESHVEIPF